jgi:hypothetical protein
MNAPLVSRNNWRQENRVSRGNSLGEQSGGATTLHGSLPNRQCNGPAGGGDESKQPGAISRDQRGGFTGEYTVVMKFSRRFDEIAEFDVLRGVNFRWNRVL